MKTQGQIEAAICEGMSRFEQDYMGRGPKDIRTHLIGDLLVIRLEGVLTAAEILGAWSHAGRLRSEAAFAAMAGVAPIPASSGQVTRYRLNRCGDRQLNCALHTIVLSRLTHHAETRRYAERRRVEGRSDREIRRCLKRFVARRIFRLLEGTATAAAA